MKRIYIILIVLMGISVSCTKNFEDMNTWTTRPTSVPPDYLFANGQLALGRQEASTSVNLNNYKLFAQYWTETTYVDEANYDMVNRNVASNSWFAYYRDCLADINQAAIILEQTPVAGEEETAIKNNKLAIISLVEAYTFEKIIDQMGNIPYTQALDINNINPAYDDAYTTYQTLISNVQAALGQMDPSYGSWGENDIYMGGDVSMWIKFGHSLLVKMGTTLADYNTTLGQSLVQDNYSGAFQSGEGCSIHFPGGAQSNPLYEDLVQSGRDDFVPTSTIIDRMNALEDPRREVYFTQLDGSYVGGAYGQSNTFSQFSHIGPVIEEATFPYVMLDFTEVAFYCAEAAARGWNVGFSAEEWYNNAITSSFLDWGLSESDAGSYLLNPDVAYGTAQGSWQQKIGVQEWLAFYVRGLEGWTTYRRLGFPTLLPPPDPKPTTGGQVPRRMTYPINEQTLNSTNYEQASKAIGGDEMSTNIFWNVQGK